MRISARCDYASKALLELTNHWPRKEPLQIHTISKRQQIPIKFLVQILIQLKRVKLVKSERGKDGGYNLAAEPGEITLGEVVRHMSGQLLSVASTANKKDSVFSTIWSDTEKSMAKVLDQITFEDIARRVSGMDRPISYHI